MDNKVRLFRERPGLYTATVRAINSGCTPVALIVECDPLMPRYKRWLVTTDTERTFYSLRDARFYINRFFENAEGFNEHARHKENENPVRL